MRLTRVLGTILILTVCAACTRTATQPDVQRHLTTMDALDVLRTAGLPIEIMNDPDAIEGLAPSPDVEGIPIRITQPSGDATGLILSFATAQQARDFGTANGGSMQTPPGSPVTSLTFAHGNLFFWAFGVISETDLKPYEIAIKTLH